MKKLILSFLCVISVNLKPNCLGPDCKPECTPENVVLDCANLMDYRTECRYGKCAYIPYMNKNLQYLNFLN